MGDIFTSVNNWIEHHQALVVAVGIPLVTGLVTAFISYRTGLSIAAAQRKDRLLQRSTKIAEFRKDWIEGLREDFAQVIAVSGARFVSKEKFDILIECYALVSKIQMKINQKDEHYQSLVDSLHSAVDAGKLAEAHDAVTKIGLEILKREWDKLKFEMNEAVK